MAGKDESQLPTPFNSGLFPPPTSTTTGQLDRDEKRDSAPEALQLWPLPSSHVDYCRTIGSRRQEGWQARMRGTSAPDALQLWPLPSSHVDYYRTIGSRREEGCQARMRSAPDALQLWPLPSSHVDYYRTIGSRREEGCQARMRVSSRRPSTLASSLLPRRLLPDNWIETRRGMSGKDESTVEIIDLLIDDCLLPVSSRRPSTLASSLLPCRLLPDNWIETRRGMSGKDESQLPTPFNSGLFPPPTSTTTGQLDRDEKRDSAPEALQLWPLPSSHVDYCRTIGSRRQEGWQARMRGTLPSDVFSPIVPPYFSSSSSMRSSDRLFS
ncbi:hypothetical protein PRIPAC_87554, partial [Pristionchus pacificus]|uniref:Uncharacterized protein n=1 Tax=Pristionchus pacificus TaxID=54126 RepID=A0A2A6CYW0_PRIPA